MEKPHPQGGVARRGRTVYILVYAGGQETTNTMRADPSQAARTASLKSGRGRYGLVAVLASIAMFAPLSTDMYLPAFPMLAEAFKDGAGIQLSLSSFFAAFAFGQLLFGPLSDRFGRKPPLYAGIGLFIASSLLCAVSPDVKTLIALRFLQGLGACAGAVIAMAVVRDVFEGREAVKIFSLLAVVGGLAPMLAPTLGGVVLLFTGWKGIFVVLATAGALCMAGMHMKLPETAPTRRRSAHPAAIARGYWKLLRERDFMLFTIAMGFGGAGMFAYIAGSPFVFMEGYGVAPWQFGLIFGCNVMGLIGSAQLNVLLMAKFAPSSIMRFSMIGQACAGAILLLTSATGIFGLPGILVPLFLYLFFMSLTRPNATAIAMAPFKRCAGTASALLGALQFVIAAGSSMAMGLAHSSSAVPMAAAIAFCGFAGAATGLFALAKAGNLDQDEIRKAERKEQPPVIAD